MPTSRRRNGRRISFISSLLIESLRASRLCPCHGGAYYADGARASGPPERGLFEYEHKIVNGALMISAGQMPTLANRASVDQPLTQIVGADSAERLAALEQPKPRCGSCQG